MTLFYQVVATFLLLNIAVGLLRIWKGPTTADRLLAIQLFGTTGTAVLILQSLEANNEAFLNVALVFALLACILGVTFTQYTRTTPQPQAIKPELTHEPE